MCREREQWTAKEPTLAAGLTRAGRGIRIRSGCPGRKAGNGQLNGQPSRVRRHRMGAAESVKGWVITGWVFTALYAVIGFWQLSLGEGLSTLVGISALVTAALFGSGAMMAGKGNYGGAKVCWIIGGILGLPLGLVMLIAGIKAGKAGATVPQATA